MLRPTEAIVYFLADCPLQACIAEMPFHLPFGCPWENKLLYPRLSDCSKSVDAKLGDRATLVRYKYFRTKGKPRDYRVYRESWLMLALLGKSHTLNIFTAQFCWHSSCCEDDTWQWYSWLLLCHMLHQHTSLASIMVSIFLENLLCIGMSSYTSPLHLKWIPIAAEQVFSVVRQARDGRVDGIWFRTQVVFLQGKQHFLIFSL